MISSIGEIQRRDDRKSTASTTAIIIYPMGFHLSKLTRNIPQNSPLGFHDPHESHNITWVMEGNRKGIFPWIDLNFPIANKIFKEG